MHSLCIHLLVVIALSVSSVEAMVPPMSQAKEEIDVRALVFSDDHNQENLFVAESVWSVQQLFEANGSDQQSLFHKITLYGICQGVITEYGSLAQCKNRIALLRQYVSSIYMVYKKREDYCHSLLLGGSEMGDIDMLNNYLILQESLKEEKKSLSTASQGKKKIQKQMPQGGSCERIVSEKAI